MMANENVTALGLRALEEQETGEGILGRGHGIHKGVEEQWGGGISQSSACGGWQSERGRGISHLPPSAMGEHRRPQTSSSVQGHLCSGNTGAPFVERQRRSPLPPGCGQPPSCSCHITSLDWSPSPRLEPFSAGTLHSRKPEVSGVLITACLTWPSKSIPVGLWGNLSSLSPQGSVLCL